MSYALKSAGSTVALGIFIVQSGIRYCQIIHMEVANTRLLSLFTTRCSCLRCLVILSKGIIMIPLICLFRITEPGISRFLAASRDRPRCEDRKFDQPRQSELWRKRDELDDSRVRSPHKHVQCSGT